MRKILLNRIKRICLVMSIVVVVSCCTGCAWKEYTADFVKDLSENEEFIDKFNEYVNDLVHWGIHHYFES